MKRKLIIVMALYLFGCGSGSMGGGGTESGNPYEPFQPSLSTAVENLVDAACTRLRTCNSNLALLDDCRNKALTIDNWDTELGLMVGAYADLAAIKSAEENESLIADEQAMTTCFYSIVQRNCSDPAVTSIFSSTASTQEFYASFALLLDDSSGACRTIFP